VAPAAVPLSVAKAGSDISEAAVTAVIRKVRIGDLLSRSDSPSLPAKRGPSFTVPVLPYGPGRESGSRR